MKLKEGKGSSTIEMAGATLRVVDVRAQTGKEASSIAIPGLTVTDAVIEFEVVEVRGRPELVDDFGKIDGLQWSRPLPTGFTLQVRSRIEICRTAKAAVIVVSRFCGERVVHAMDTTSTQVARLGVVGAAVGNPFVGASEQIVDTRG